MTLIRRLSTPRTELILLLISLPLALILISPLYHIALRASSIDLQDTFDYLTRRGTLNIVSRSFTLVVTVSLASCVISIPAAWLTERTNLVGRRLWIILLMLPLVIPSYVGAFALIGAIGPRGFLQGWLESAFGVERIPSIYGFFGSWLSITLFTYPYVFSSVRAGLRGIDPALEEASRTLGKSAFQTFWGVTLAQLRPFIAGGALLVALYTLGEFGAVSMMQYDVFSRAIYFQLGFNRSNAALLSLVLVFFSVMIMLAVGVMEGRGRYYTRSVNRSRPIVRLGYWQVVAQLFLGFVVLLALVAPLGVISYWLINGLLEDESLRDVIGPLQRSLRVAALAAIASVIAALPFAALSVRYPSWYNRIIMNSVYLGYALPGVVIGLALTFFGARYLLGTAWLGLDNYRIIPLLIFAYMVLFLPQALSPTRAGFMQINPHLEEAAQILGKQRLVVFGSITLPLLRPSVVAGMALVFLTVMKELPATLMLAPIGYDTLATRIWSATEEAFYARAAAPALVLVLFSALSLVFILESDE